MELLRRKDLGPCTESGQRTDGSFEKRSKKKAPCLLPDVYGQGKDKALFASRPSFGDACLRPRRRASSVRAVKQDAYHVIKRSSKLSRGTAFISGFPSGFSGFDMSGTKCMAGRFL